MHMQSKLIQIKLVRSDSKSNCHALTNTVVPRLASLSNARLYFLPQKRTPVVQLAIVYVCVALQLIRLILISFFEALSTYAFTSAHNEISLLTATST
ncbi:hypothetical protein BDQ12DRAFT_9156 [Crucibulum laeve]|uniref:Uncharacterized protein n=1 Tax=Crucibulum laeve TaxID=68775 RepID=A0A5C3MH91_9AGAR|nr:hypothetical protein BDQ12DRAFT_9156 [Crucibulum laeve]